MHILGYKLFWLSVKYLSGFINSLWDHFWQQVPKCLLEYLKISNNVLN